MITKEEWLRHAVELLDADVFKGGLNLIDTKYEISWGRTKGNKVAECVFPYDGPDVQLDDFFPNTIFVNAEEQDPIMMICGLAHACIQCFYGIRSTNNKKFKTLAESFYFDAPLNKCTPSSYLRDLVTNIYKKLVEKYGEFPGKPIVIRKKEREKGNSNVVKLFCPSCGYEVKTTRKMFEKHNKQLPTCVCGTKMAQDLEDEESED